MFRPLQLLASRDEIPSDVRIFSSDRRTFSFSDPSICEKLLLKTLYPMGGQSFGSRRVVQEVALARGLI